MWRTMQVLSDEGKRRIYDVYGLKGLQSGLEVGPYLRNPEEVYREYERLKALEVSVFPYFSLEMHAFLPASPNKAGFSCNSVVFVLF